MGRNARLRAAFIVFDTRFSTNIHNNHVSLHVLKIGNDSRHAVVNNSTRSENSKFPTKIWNNDSSLIIYIQVDKIMICMLL